MGARWHQAQRDCPDLTQAVDERLHEFSNQLSVTVLSCIVLYLVGFLAVVWIL